MIEVLLGLLIIVLTTSVITLYAAVYNTKYWKRRGINGPQCKPFTGNMCEWWGSSNVFHLREWTKKYGKVYGIQEGWKNILVVSDVDMLHELFVKKFEYFHGRKVSLLLGNIDKEPRTHVFNARGARWKRLRAVANPVFSVSSLKKIMPIVDDSCREMMKFLDKAYEEGQSFNIHPYFHELTMDVIARIAMGQTESLQFRSEFTTIAKRVFAQFGTGKIVYFAETLPFLSPLLKKIGKFIGTLRKQPLFVFFDVIEKEVKKRRKEKDNGVKKEVVDFIDLFLEVEGEIDKSDEYKLFDRASTKISKKMTVEEIIGACFVFLLAGFDTTANALANTCYYLACNPDKQKILQQEIDEVCGCPEGDISYEQISRLNYTEATIKEVLRLVPIASFACNRTCFETTTLGNYKIETGTVVQADVWTIHYDKNLWGDNADTFYPERWLEKGSLSNQTATWLPFGSGPRTCIGLRLAYLEEKLALIHILSKYNLVRTEMTEKELKMVGMTVLNPESVTIKLMLR